MLKRIALLSLLLVPAHSQATRPESTGGKIVASIIRIANRHPYLFTLPLASLSFSFFRDRSHGPDRDDFTPWLMSLATWYVSGRLLKTTTKVIMDEYDISPVID
jgi:hypothetical protein